MTMTAPEYSRTMTRIFPGKISPAHEVNLSFRVSNKLTEFPVMRKLKPCGPGSAPDLCHGPDPGGGSCSVRAVLPYKF
jgi:hypothetical protein